ncbi:MAG: methyltransferase domain-containing protein [Gammaproteobacteria bacterium]|nr:methyltransferase domain-containing protein [Gammaproteobacteria bacterium]MDH3534251.1 methyltransferase domain-containing protein [Gammaproteobacteria bacterium]
MKSSIKTFDVYGNTETLDEPVLDVVATRLEARGKHPTFQQMLYEYLDCMNIDNLHDVLDLGCGTGFAAREIAKRPNFSGNIIGVDISSALINQASKLAADEGLSSRVDFRVGDSRNLEDSDESFDAVIAHTLISHLPDPQVLINEMIRLSKPGGFVAIFDGDYASLTFSHPDAEKGKAIDELIISSIVTQSRILRQLPLFLKSSGLEIEKAFSYVVTDVGKAEFWASSVESMRKLLPAANAMSAEEADTWANDRSQESDNGTFFASCNYYAYVARKPGAH